MNAIICTLIRANCLRLTAVLLLQALLLQNVHAQILSKKTEYKVSPTLRLKLVNRQTTNTTATFTVVLRSIDSVDWKKLYKKVKLLGTYTQSNIVVVTCTLAHLTELLQDENILWADEKQIAKEELLLGFVDYSANNITTIQNRFPQLNGENISVSIKEQMFDSSDIDFTGRILPSAHSASSVSAHASLIATIVSGGGNAWYNTKGAGWKSKISSASFLNLLPEPNSYYQTPILVQNHSYGTVIESYYGAEAAAYDASVIVNPSVVHVFSAGNSGNAFSPTGAYANMNGYANLTGNFKQAKNIITVGHTDSIGRVLSPSSKGPAFDGRIKPELVAFGEDGSSGAAALVSGVATVLHNTYRTLNSNNNAPASVIKAVLLNSADDIDSTGIDYRSGFGKLNAVSAINTLLQNHYLTENISASGQRTFNLTVPSGVKKLKVTLAWTDPAASPGVAKALTNDLDLELKHIATGTTWLPWVLNPSPSISSLEELPVRKKDTLNVTEQITLDDPISGNYQIVVKSSLMQSGPQSFAIAYQFDTINRFNWLFPTSSDYLFPSNSHFLRFQSSFTNSTGLLEYSLDNGNSWQNIDASADLSKGYYKWTAANIFGKALVAVTTNGIRYVSDTFTIGNRIIPSIGFNCKDSFLLVWPKIYEATAYKISRLGPNYMEQLLITTDTFLLLAKKNNPEKFYNITPLLNRKSAGPSYTFNYDLQGVTCYIKSFLANITLNNSVLLSLELGTGYQVNKIRFEKLTTAGFVTINEQTLQNGLLFNYEDMSLINGSNTYRVAVVLLDGRIYYSDNAIVYFAGSKDIVVYPIPAHAGEPVLVLSNTREEYIFQLFDISGRLVLQEKLQSFPQRINVLKLQRGLYIYRATNSSGKKVNGKLILN